MFLTKFAEQVYLIHRRDELRATKCIQERCFANEKIEMRVEPHPRRDHRDTRARSRPSAWRPRRASPTTLLPLDGVFEFIGVHPNSDLVAELCDLAEGGWVHIDNSCMTSVPGLFAAGDVTDTPLKQVVTAAGQGATAAFEALRHVDSGVCTL